MNVVGIIAKNTYKEVIRDRILIGIIVFAFMLIGLSIALGQLSWSEQARISANFGLTGIHISVAILSVFVGSTLVYKEIEKQTILTLLARPVTRGHFLIGKFLGLTMINITVMIGLALILAALVEFLDLRLEVSFLIALTGIFLEGMILTATSLFFGSFAKPITTVIFTASVFLLGHWVRSLDFFLEKSESGVFKAVAKGIRFLLPDLERFNWRSAPIYNHFVPAAEFGWAVLYGGMWVFILILFCVASFRRRDFV